MIRNDRIVFIGDSITLGANVSETERFSNRIATACGYPIGECVNLGVGSNTSAQILARIGDAVSYQPGVCVIMAGANDVATGVTPIQYACNLQQMAAVLQVAGIKAVFISSMLERGDNALFQKWNPYIQAQELVVAQVGARYVDLYREIAYCAFRGEHLPLYADNIHPSAAGHQFIAEYCTRSIHKWKFLP